MTEQELIPLMIQYDIRNFNYIAPAEITKWFKENKRKYPLSYVPERIVDSDDKEKSFNERVAYFRQLLSNIQTVQGYNYIPKDMSIFADYLAILTVWHKTENYKNDILNEFKRILYIEPKDTYIQYIKYQIACVIGFDFPDHGIAALESIIKQGAEQFPCFDPKQI